MTELPKVLKENIDEIKTPSNRVLIISLFLALITVCTFYYASITAEQRDAKKEIRRLNSIIDKLTKDALLKAEAESVTLRAAAVWQDSIRRSLEHIVNLKK